MQPHYLHKYSRYQNIWKSSIESQSWFNTQNDKAGKKNYFACHKSQTGQEARNMKYHVILTK